MSVKTEIERIEQAKADIRTAITDKGQPVSETETLSEYPKHIRAIETGAKINDDVVAIDKTWSSEKIHSEDESFYKKVIETTCPVFSITAPVVTCHPVADYPLHVVSKIDVRQEGDGDPSPTNVRPIVATDKVELTRCGTLLDVSKAVVRNEATVDVKNGVIHAEKLTESKYCAIGLPDVPVEAGKTYILRARFVSKHSDAAIYAETYDGVNLVANGVSTPFVSEKTGKIGIGIRINNQVSEVGDFLDIYALSFNDDGETYTAQLPPDTYGGEVDWDKKEYFATWASAVMDGKEPWKWDGENFTAPIIPGYQTILPNVGFCDKALYVESTSADGLYIINGTAVIGSAMCAKFDNDAQKWADYLKTNPYTVITKALKFGEAPVTPITTSGAPTALPGENNLYSSTGDTTVSGREDPKATFRKQQEEIEELKKAIIATGGNL